MSILKPAKLYFSELLQLDRKHEKKWKDSLNLSKIEEESEGITEVAREDCRGLRQDFAKSVSPDLPKSPRSLFLIEFLNKVVRFPKVFNGFVNRASDLGCLAGKRSEKPKIRLNQSQKLVKHVIDSDLEESSILSQEDFTKKPATARKGIIFSHLWRFQKNKNESPQTASSTGSSVRRVATGTANVSNFRSLRRRLTLKPNDPDFIKIFRRISGEKAKISNDEFRAYLLTRYPGPMVDSMLKFFNFKYTSFDDYVSEMNRFVAMGEERHLNFCFELFDLNKDRRINYQDTFKAMEIRTGSHYDEDLIMILEMFDIKAAGSVKGKGARVERRRSTFSLIKDEHKNAEAKDLKDLKDLKEEKKAKPKNVAINYTEFSMIKFNVRPQILQDFLKFTCNYEFLTERNALQPTHGAKESEVIVMDMNLNPEANDKLMKSDKYEYYCALDSAMGLFGKAQLEDLLKKFKFLQSDERLRLKVINKQSMIEKLVMVKQPEIFGYNNAYISERFYEFLSQGKDLTKASFLHKCHAVLANPGSLTTNRLAFELIDLRKDNKLSVDEIYYFFEAIPHRSKVYSEVLV